MTSHRPHPQELRGTSRLRTDVLPAPTTILLRAGPVGVLGLIEQARDTGRRFTLDGAPFFALSLSAVVHDSTEETLLSSAPFVGFPSYYRMTAGSVTEAGFRLWATFRRREHYDVQLPAADEPAIVAFLAVAGPLHHNRFYRP